MKKILSLLLLAAALSPVASFAKPAVFMKFTKAYPDAKALAAKRCVICHESMSDFRRNPYGQDVEKAALDFAAIEALDSDGDGFTNIEEIKAGTLPGNKDSYPEHHAE